MRRQTVGTHHHITKRNNTDEFLQGIFTAGVNNEYIIDTTNSTANITITMPTATLGDTITVADMKGNFISGGAKNVVTDTITFEGSSTTFEFDEANKLKTLMYVDATYGWKSI